MYLSVICLPAAVAKAGRGDGSDCLIFSLDVACIYLDEEQGGLRLSAFSPGSDLHLFADLHLFQIYFYLQNFIYLHKDMNFLADGIRNLSL